MQRRLILKQAKPYAQHYTNKLFGNNDTDASDAAASAAQDLSKDQ